MKKKQVAKIVGIIVIVGCVAGTTAFAGTSKMKVAVAAVGQGDVVRTIAVEGHIETEEEKAYYAKVTAPVSAFDLKAGDVVQKVIHWLHTTHRNMTEAWSRHSYRLRQLRLAMQEVQHKARK